MLREVFLEPTWRDSQEGPAAPEPRQVSAVPAYRPPVDRSRLEEPADDRAALLSARLLSAHSPPANPSALHWSRRPAAPHPPAVLTRAVQPKDLLTFGDQAAARGAFRSKASSPKYAPSRMVPTATRPGPDPCEATAAPFTTR